MPTYRVLKSIAFCYGHRLLNYRGPCCHVHGHNGRADIVVAADALNTLGMVHDFREIKNVVKTWIDAHLDHRMILQEGDPLIALLQAQQEPVYIMDRPPTAENLAREICVVARNNGLPVCEVRLWESDASCAVYAE